MVYPTKKGDSREMIGYYDANYAGDHNTRQSTIGHIIILGLGAVSCCSRRQATMSLSTTEVEYRAVAVVAQECTCMVNAVKEGSMSISQRCYFAIL